MTDDVPNLILERLRRMDEKLDRVITEQSSQGRRITGLENGLAHLEAGIAQVAIRVAEVSTRLDHTNERLDRIERRLDLDDGSTT